MRAGALAQRDEHVEEPAPGDAARHAIVRERRVERGERVDRQRESVEPARALGTEVGRARDRVEELAVEGPAARRVHGDVLHRVGDVRGDVRLERAQHEREPPRDEASARARGIAEHAERHGVFGRRHRQHRAVAQHRWRGVVVRGVRGERGGEAQLRRGLRRQRGGERPVEVTQRRREGERVGRRQGDRDDAPRSAGPVGRQAERTRRVARELSAEGRAARREHDGAAAAHLLSSALRGAAGQRDERARADDERAD